MGRGQLIPVWFCESGKKRIELECPGRRQIELTMEVDESRFGSGPHRRFNPLKSEWVLVSPHRNDRPWQGLSEEMPSRLPATHDPDCYLCPGNKRASGIVNPDYEGPFVFTNDFPALLPDQMPDQMPDQTVGQNAGQAGEDSLFRSMNVSGTSRVLCFSPRHDLGMAELGVAGIRQVIDVWADQTAALGKDYAWVAIFENKGAAMGCSNPHPHGQIWASDFIPSEIMREDESQKAYLRDTGSVMLVDYAEAEIKHARRVVVQNDAWLAVVPYWAVWPFETLVLPRRHALRMTDLDAAERDELAVLMRELTIRYDNLFSTDFPYSMGWHGAPHTDMTNDHWQLHAHFYPPLLRSATIRKFMVGYEMLAEAQRDMTPEHAAELLRAVPARHYRQR